MSGVFEKYNEVIIGKEAFKELVKNDPEKSKDYVYYWINGKETTKYIPIETINNILFEIIKNKFENKKKYTDTKLLHTIADWHNVIYIDIDYYFSIDEDIGEVISFNSELSDIINELVVETFPNSHFMTFVPGKIKYEVDEKTKEENRYRAKGGIHTFVFCDECFEDVNEKTEIVYNMFKESNDFNILFENYRDKLLDKNSNKLSLRSFIDESTIKKTTSLIPYGQKSDSSRRYKLIKHNLQEIMDGDGFEFVKRNDKIIRRVIATTYDESNDCLNFAKYYNSDENIMFKEIINKAKIKETYSRCINSSDKESWTSTILKIDSFVFSFLDGLGSLCYEIDDEDRQHHFYRNIFVNWNSRHIFTTRLLEFYLACLVVNLGKYMPTNKDVISRRLTELMAPLYVRLGKLNSTEKIKAIEWSSADKMKHIFKIYKEGGEVYHEYINASPKEQAKMIKKWKKEDERSLKRYNKIQKYISFAFSNWAKFVIDNIMKPITFEIEPFEWKSYTRGNLDLSFDHVLPIISKTGKSLSLCVNKVTEYMRQLRNLNKMFIFCVTYEKGINKVDNIIGEIILAYVKTYVMYIEDDEGLAKNNYKSVYIYNVKQTENLTKYPFNQWIIDKEENLKNWIFVIYKNLFEPLLDTSSTNQIDGLGMPFRMLETTKFVEKIQPGKLITSLKSPFTYQNASRNLLGNVLATYESERHIIPTPEDPERSRFFAMRNGIIEWIQKEDGSWTYKFRTDNRDIRLGAYTLINFKDPKKYDKKNPYYTKLKEVIRQTYPEDDEREYILDLFSTVIVPFIKKDQILVAFGTGGDGKSTMNVILMNMLGHGTVGGTNYNEGDGKVLLCVPAGYSGNVNPATFTHSKQQGNGHDEGGKVNMARKTFVVSQEPEQNRSLVTSVIKDLTSGSVSHGRQIHKREIMFVNNALIVMETNKVLNYDNVDDAVKRRMIVYKHQAKFTTNVNEKQMENVKWHFPANTKLINEIQTTTEYWDALFQILLEHGLKILNKGYANLSDIKPPESVYEFTQYSFNNSSPLLQYLHENYEESPNSYMFVKELILNIIEKDKLERELGNGSVLKSSNINTKRIEIIEELQKKYNGSFFRINKQYYKPNSKQLKSNWEDEFEENTRDLDIDEIINLHTDGNGALTDLSQDSRLKYENLIIKGYKKKEFDGDD